jgi:hypothetical protein
VKARYGNVEIDLPSHRCWIFGYAEAATPVFHRNHGHGSGTTACGLQLSNVLGVVGLPLKHAMRIGRPCAACWPQLRAQPALFQRTPRRRTNDTQGALV